MSKGGFVGPATVLAHLRQPTEEGRLRNQVILVFRGQVMRAAPQQLRLVSDAERTLFEVDEESRKLLHAKANEAMSRLNRVIDISDEGEPDLDELEVPPVQGGGPVEPEGPAAHGGPGERQVPAEPEGPGERQVPAEPDGPAQREA